MEQLCDFLKALDMEVKVEVNPYCGCLHENVQFDFPKLCLGD